MFETQISPHYGPNNFRLFLVDEFARRKQANPRYSLELLARKIGLHRPHLSMILSGKRKLTVKLIEQIGMQLKLSVGQIDGFKNSLRIEKQFGTIYSEQGANRIYRSLENDVCEMVSDLRHYVILATTQLDDFDSSREFISRRMNLDLQVLAPMIERLENLGYIDTTTKPWQIKNGHLTSLHSDFDTSDQLRRGQSNLLNDAVVALDRIPIELRSQTSITVSTSVERIQAAKQLVTKFRRELCEFLEASPKKEAVYHLSLSLFPATTLERENSESICHVRKK